MPLALLPGGKICREEKPAVFIRPDALVVRAGLKIKGLRPLDNPLGIFKANKMPEKIRALMNGKY